MPSPYAPTKIYTSSHNRVLAPTRRTRQDAQRQLDQHIAAAGASRYASLTKESKLVFQVAKNRLAERGGTGREDDVVKYLNDYLRRTGARTHLFPIPEGDLNDLVYGIMNRKLTLSNVLHTNAGQWNALLTGMMELIRQGYEDFERVAIEQSKEDWLDDTRWKRFALKVVTVLISAALAGVGFGALGGALGQVFSDAVGDSCREISKEAIKGAIGGALGEIGVGLAEFVTSPMEMDPRAEAPQLGSNALAVPVTVPPQGTGRFVIKEDKLSEELTKLAGAGADSKKFLNDMQGLMLTSYKEMSTVGLEMVEYVVQVFCRKVVKHLAWQCLFNSPLDTVDERTIKKDTRELLTLTFDDIQRDFQTLFACPFTHDSGAKHVVEKFCWAVYIEERLHQHERDPGAKKRDIGNPVIDRLVALGVGARRQSRAWAWNTSRFQADSDQTVATMNAVVTATGDRFSAFQSAERDLKFGKTKGGAWTNAQLEAWAKTYRSLHPMRLLFKPRENVLNKMAAGNAKVAQQLDAWKDAHTRAKAAAQAIVAL